MSATENPLNKCIWTLCYILLCAEFLKDLHKYILQDLRLTDSSHYTRTSQFFQVAWAGLIQQPYTAAASQETCAQTHTFARTSLCFCLFTKGLWKTLQAGCYGACGTAACKGVSKKWHDTT